jgi:hypothetical protein
LAVFSGDGDLADSATRSAADLSARWLEYCGRLLEANGESFSANLDGILPHFRLRFTAAVGAAIATIYVHELVAVSAVMLSGRSPQADEWIRTQFIASLVESPLAKVGGVPTPFGALVAISDRPLTGLVFCAGESLTEQEVSAAAQLSEHLAAAYFERARGVVV